MTLAVVGVLAACYLAWAYQRVSPTVLFYDKAWPRGGAYPDSWLMVLNDWYDARYPSSTGIKLHGELQRVRDTVLLGCCAAGLVAAAGMGGLLWPRVRRSLDRSRRGFEVEVLKAAQ